MATNRTLLGIVCFAFAGSGGLFNSDLLKTGQQDQPAEKILHIARRQIGVREKTGKNDGTAVEAYLKYVGLAKGQPWCAAFVSWTYGQAGYALPRTGWSPALFPNSKKAGAPSPGHVFGIYFSELKRVAHVGFVDEIKGDWIVTIEGNTNVAGSREGDGVYTKLRHKRTIYGYADWKQKGKSKQEGGKRP